MADIEKKRLSLQKAQGTDRSAAVDAEAPEKAQILYSAILDGPQEVVQFISKTLESSTEYSIICLDLKGTILLWNEGARRLYGYVNERGSAQPETALAEPVAHHLPGRQDHRRPRIHGQVYRRSPQQAQRHRFLRLFHRAGKGPRALPAGPCRGEGHGLPADHPARGGAPDRRALQRLGVQGCGVECPWGFRRGT